MLYQNVGGHAVSSTGQHEFLNNCFKSPIETQRPFLKIKVKKFIILLLTMDLGFVSQAIHEAAPLLGQKMSLHSEAESEKKNIYIDSLASIST